MMFRTADDIEGDEIDFRPQKRTKVATEDDDSAYVSLASPGLDQDEQPQSSPVRTVEKMSVDLQSVASTTSRRPKTFHCTYEGCDKAFDRPARLEIHIRSHTHDRPFICGEADCGKSFLRSEHLKAHITSKHSDIRNYICTYEVGKTEDGGSIECGKSFHTGTRLRRHVAAHEDKEQTKCQECGQIFRKQETLQRHIRSEHLGENAFRCRYSDDNSEECGQMFPTIGQLKSHETRAHSFTRYFCDICQSADDSQLEGFFTYAHLQTHIKLAHPPICTLCGEPCASVRALKAHMDIVHSALSDRQRFACDHPGCGRKFTKKGNLSVHVRNVHANEKNYTCGVYDLSGSAKVPGWTGIGCGSSFGTKASLEGHVRTQHLGLDALGKIGKVSSARKLGSQKTARANAETNAIDHKIVSSLTGHAYEDTRPLPCIETNCESRFRHEHELSVHLELHHGWNIDDINECLAETAALQGDKFWIGGAEDNSDLLDQFLVSNLSISEDTQASQASIAPTLPNANALDPALC